MKNPEKEAEKARKKQDKLKIKEERAATALPGFFSKLNRKGHNLFATAGSKEQLDPDNVRDEVTPEPTTYGPADGDLEAARPAEEEDVETPSLSLTLTIVLLVVVTVVRLLFLCRRCCHVDRVHLYVLSWLLSPQNGWLIL